MKLIESLGIGHDSAVQEWRDHQLQRLALGIPEVSV